MYRMLPEQTINQLQNYRQRSVWGAITVSMKYLQPVLSDEAKRGQPDSETPMKSMDRYPSWRQPILHRKIMPRGFHQIPIVIQKIATLCSQPAVSSTEGFQTPTR